MGRPGVPVVPVYVVLIVLDVAVKIWLIAVILKAFWRQAMKAWLVTLLAPLVIVVITLFLYRPFCAEAFTTAGNSMAPTLLAGHWQGVCPYCGQPSFASPTTQWEPAPPGEVPMICSNCLRTSTFAGSPQTTFPGDRFVVNKFLQPRRWDIVAFRYPADPAMTFVKRLVGLPGETLFIHDGAVWINGQRIEPPEELRGLQYLDKMEGLPWGTEIWGSKKKPAVLGKDEYFVLGDFSARSKDSRLWEQGAPGTPRMPCRRPMSWAWSLTSSGHRVVAGCCARSKKSASASRPETYVSGSPRDNYRLVVCDVTRPGQPRPCCHGDGPRGRLVGRPPEKARRPSPL